VLIFCIHRFLFVFFLNIQRDTNNSLALLPCVEDHLNFLTHCYSFCYLLQFHLFVSVLCILFTFVLLYFTILLHMCLPSRCPETALVYSSILRSLQRLCALQCNKWCSYNVKDVNILDVQILFSKKNYAVSSDLCFMLLIKCLDVLA
jgi:hypothetical protein